jgi:RNase P subunit RPR2
MSHINYEIWFEHISQGTKRAMKRWMRYYYCKDCLYKKSYSTKPNRYFYSNYVTNCPKCGSKNLAYYTPPFKKNVILNE